MGTLVDALRSEATKLAHRGGSASRQVLDDATGSILSRADDISDMGPSLGAEVVSGLFGALEGSMRKAMAAAATHKAQERALTTFYAKIGPDASKKQS